MAGCQGGTGLFTIPAESAAQGAGFIVNNLGDIPYRSGSPHVNLFLA